MFWLLFIETKFDIVTFVQQNYLMLFSHLINEFDILITFVKHNMRLSSHLCVSLDLVGDGTFSQVYKGKYQDSGVAVKQLKTSLVAADRNYFAAEVRT